MQVAYDGHFRVETFFKRVSFNFLLKEIKSLVLIYVLLSVLVHLPISNTNSRHYKSL